MLGETMGDAGPVQKVGSPKDMVLQWNQKRKEYDKLNEDWSPAVAEHLVGLRRDMAVIEETCIFMYAVSELIEPLKAMERWKGRSLLGPLNKQYDNDALTALLARIANTVGSSYKAIMESYENENDIPLDVNGDDVWGSVSMVIWHLLSAFWEIGTARALGRPENVYVTVNIRNMLAGIVCENMVAQEINHTDRDNIYAGFRNFMEEFRVNIEHYFDGKDGIMAEVYAVSIFHNMDKAKVRGETLDRVFANFVQQASGLPMRVTDTGL